MEAQVGMHTCTKLHQEYKVERRLVINISGVIKALKYMPVLPPDWVQKALSTGVFESCGKKYPCEQEVEEATSLMLKRVADTYQWIAGGALSWDIIIFTGGGSALLYQRLLSIINHENIVLADKLEDIHFANVSGGLKLWLLYEALQV